MCDASTEQVGLGCRRKQAKAAVGSKLMSCMVSASVPTSDFCPGFPQ